MPQRSDKHAPRQRPTTPFPSSPRCRDSSQTSTPTQTSTPSPSLGTSLSPSVTPSALPFGAIRDVLLLDCNAGLHILPGMPLEVNVNLRGLRHMADYGAAEIREVARCTADTRNWCEACDL